MGHATKKLREIGVGRGGLAVAAMVVLAGTPTALAQSGWNVTLLNTLAGDGSDCWGYVSASGREYALVSNRGTTKFVEITDPANIVVIDEVPHPASLWADIKTYGDFAYAVAESSGSGIQVFDLSDIDNGNVAHVRTMLSPSSSHNVVIDTDSGFMYLSGGAIFSLANPVSPVRVGTGPNWHDAQVVTYQSGVYAGKEILFGSAGSRGLEIYDVSNKSNPVRLSLTTYPMLGYCHQGWLSDDRQYFYANDEFDESNFGITTRTLIFDVSDLSNPTLAGTFTTGLNSIDHNLYYKDGFLFEANYTSGLRVIDACDPVNLVEAGYYDTYSPNNGASFNGAWSVYPFFPSGVCIINNIGGALYIVDPSAAVSEPCHTGCPCACDMDTGAHSVCDIFDFLAFQNGFVAGERCSCNFDVSTGVDVCDIFDFLAFQDDFAGGFANCR